LRAAHYYFEDPVFRFECMRRTREMVRFRLATTGVELLALPRMFLNTAVDVILLDTTFWGGLVHS